MGGGRELVSYTGAEEIRDLFWKRELTSYKEMSYLIWHT